MITIDWAPIWALIVVAGLCGVITALLLAALPGKPASHHGQFQDLPPPGQRCLKDEEIGAA